MAQRAEHYVIAGMNDDAIKCYLKLAEKDPRGYSLAAEILERQNKDEQALAYYVLGRDSKKVTELAVRHHSWTVLRDYLADKPITRECLRMFQEGTLHAFIAGLPQNESTIGTIAHWIEWTHSRTLIGLALEKSLGDIKLMTHLWANLSHYLAGNIVKLILQKEVKSSEQVRLLYLVSARALFNNRRYHKSSKLYEAAGRYLMAAKCRVEIGDFDRATALLRSGGEQGLATQLQRSLESTPTPTANPKTGRPDWPPEALNLIRQLLSAIDPDIDEAQSRSPFALTA